MIYLVISAYLLLVVPKIFSFTSIFHIRPLIGLIVPYLLASIFFGMFVSCIIRYRENVMLLVVFASIPLLFLSGISWPQSNIPGYWQGFSWLFPSTFGVRGFIRLNSMGATLQDIAPEYRALWYQVIAYFLATCAVYRYQIISTRHRATNRIEVIKERARQIIEKRKLRKVNA